MRTLWYAVITVKYRCPASSRRVAAATSVPRAPVHCVGYSAFTFSIFCCAYFFSLQQGDAFVMTRLVQNAAVAVK